VTENCFHQSSSVNCLASASTVRPCAHKVAEVTGPIEAIRTPCSASGPAIASRFLTAEELVNVIQSGLFSLEKILSRAQWR